MIFQISFIHLAGSTSPDSITLHATSSADAIEQIRAIFARSVIGDEAGDEPQPFFQVSEVQDFSGNAEARQEYVPAEPDQAPDKRKATRLR